MSEDLLVTHCSPTLAGLKTGNLFSCKAESPDVVCRNIRRLNRMLVPCGIRLMYVVCKNGRLLLYLYRPQRLAQDLRRPGADAILRSLDYPVTNPVFCVAELLRRMASGSAFPHEAGLFLGYPVEDVEGFMSGTRAPVYTGAWKVYGDVAAAEKTFAKYKKCTDVYCNCLKNGGTIERLTIAV